MEHQKEYYAFISYKREDEKWAKWLQHKLEHYKFPTNLNGRTDLPKNIRPTFRDVTELSPEPLEQAINNALQNSQWLIIVCSPRSAKSPWVCKEAQTFIDLGRADHIIPFVIEGNPFSNDIASECYPEALLNLTGSQELLAANINEMGRDAAVIKVVSRMFGLRFDALWQRHEREKRRRRNRAFFFVCVSSACIAGLAFFIGGLNSTIQHMRSQGAARSATELLINGDSYKSRVVAQTALSYSYSSDAEAVLRQSYNIESTIFYGHLGEAYDVAYCPINKLIASASRDSTIRIWNFVSGNCIDCLHGHKDGVGSVLFFHNGEKLVSSSKDKSIKIWDIHTGTCDTTLDKKDKHCRALAINREESLLASGSNEKIILWDLKTLNCIDTLDGHADIVQSLSFTPDGKKLVSVSSDKTIMIWDLDSMKCTDILYGHTKRVLCCSVSPDGKKIATSSSDNTVRIWDFQRKKCIDTLLGHNDEVTCVKYSEDGKKLVSSSFDNTIRIWNISDASCDTILFGHVGRVYSALLVDNRHCLSVSSDKTIRLWDLTPNTSYDKLVYVNSNHHNHPRSIIDSLFNEFEKVSNIDERPTNAIYSLNDSLIFVSNNNHNNIYIFARNLYLKDTIKITGKDGITSMDISPEGVFLAAGCRNGEIFIYESSSNNHNLIKTLHFPSKVMSVVFSPNGNYLMASGGNGYVCMWDTKDWGPISNEIKGHSELIRQGTFSTDSKYFVTSSLDKTIKLWQISSDVKITLRPLNEKNEKLIRKVFDIFCIDSSTAHLGWCTGVAFSPRDNCLVSVSEDRSILFWKIKKGKLKRTGQILNAHKSNISSVSFSPSGKYLVTSSNDNTIKIWETKSRKCILTYSGSFKCFYSANFSHDEKNIIATNENGYIYVWDFPTLKGIIDLTREHFKDNPLTPEERRQYYLDK